MRAGRVDPFELAVGELDAMTADLRMLHEQSSPAHTRTSGERSADVADRGGSTARRSFLAGVGGATILGAAAACTRSDRAVPGPTGSSGEGDRYTGDMKVVAVAAALENLVVTVYQGSLDAAAAGTLGTVPPAVARFVKTAMRQHMQHAASWNSVLTKAQVPTVTGAPLTITRDHLAQVNAARSVHDLLTLALGLESAAAQTYAVTTGTVQDAGAIMTAAAIGPVEAMHAAILNFMLGTVPVPDTYLGVSAAVRPGALTD